ncbi:MULTISPECIES: hypothetical protein [unclassified Exiguobacterium]|uniref:hypothetical protein n=1 Tax=unclassified Exiguobacterium TaxID=2644629 RepID=UPI001BE8F4F8|nr:MULTISPECIES: hypothetical protein [unclassified Exiguobacterium]
MYIQNVLWELWIFFRPFAFGSLGGLAGILMSQVNRNATLAITKSKIIIKYKNEDELVSQIVSDVVHEVVNESDKHKYFTVFVHCLVGGISGMIAVNAFNLGGNAPQTFSIAVIAGVSGFAFLKRSALIDDGTADKLVGMEGEFLEEYLEKYIAKYREAKTIMTEMTSTDESKEVSLVKTLLEEESLQVEELPNFKPSEEFEDFIKDFKNMPGIEADDVQYLRRLFYAEGKSLDDILDFLDISEE